MTPQNVTQLQFSFQAEKSDTHVTHGLARLSARMAFRNFALRLRSSYHTLASYVRWKVQI
jgi:hypothetical protein